MKIGFVSSVYPEYPDEVYGNFVHRLARELTAQGHTVTVVSPYRGDLSTYDLEGVSVRKFHYFWPHRWERLCGRGGMSENIKEGWFVKLQLIPYAMMIVWATLRTMRDVDVIHVHWPLPNALGAWFARPITRRPYITTVYGDEAYLAKQYHFSWLLRRLTNAGRKIVVISEGTRAAYLEAGCVESKMVLIPMGVRADVYYPKKIKRKSLILNVISVGYLIERKGFDYLIRAFARVLTQHPGAHLRIVGTGPRRDELLKLIDELKINGAAEILEGVTDAQLLDLYNSADVFVLSSITDSLGNTEGLGIVMLEAMACRVPVVASAVGGIGDVIRSGENGLLVPEKDTVALSQAILNLADDQDLRHRLAENGYRTAVEDFGWENIAAKYAVVYEEAVKRP